MLWVSLLVGSGAWGSTTGKSFEIPEQRADLALMQFAQQAHLVVLFPYDEVSRVAANRLVGRYSVRDGVDILLKDTGLTASLESDCQLVVRVFAGSTGADNEMKPQHRKGLLTSFLAGMAALGGAAGPAGAQDDSSATTPAPASSLAEVTVTGSRLRDTGMQSPTPVTVVTAEQLDLVAPGNIIDAFKQLPQFLGGSSPGVTYYIGGDAGQSILNMRGLGENRTLVLLDGRRIVPSTYSGTVDINVLPQSLVKRTEVVTGGASAAYGTDAVAGVTNFILDTDYTGLKGRAQGGITGVGDGANKEAELTFGTPIGQKAHLVASVDYYDQNAIETWSGRPWFQDWGLVNNPAYVAGGSQPQLLLMPHVTSSVYTQGGLIRQPGSPLNNLMFLPDGSAVPFQLGIGSQAGLKTQSGGSGYDYLGDRGGDGGVQPDVSRYNAFTHLSVNLTDDVEVFGEVMVGHNEVDGRGLGAAMFGTWQATIYADNAYLPQSIKNVMAQQGLSSFGFSRFSSSADLSIDRLIQTNSTVEYSTGVKAVLPGDWHFNSYIEHGRNESDLAAVNFPRTDRLFLALDAVVNPATGSITCKVNLVQPGYGCVPINLFGAGNATPQAIQYVTDGTKTSYLTNTQDAFEATVDGKLFKNWAPGAISAAFGVDFRHNHAAQNVVDPTNPTNDPSVVAVPFNNPALGIEGIPTAYAGGSSGVQLSGQANFSGTINVSEVFGEIQVPLLKDQPFAKDLSMNMAGRWADYSGSGGIWSYKYGLDWQSLDWLRFRGTYSRDVRAADMSERFNAAANGGTVNDPFKGGQSVTFTQIQGGNPNVTPEEADTFSAGVVLQPTFAQGLSLSVDWYSIDIKNAIALPGVQNIVNFCYEGDQAMCANIQRDPATGQIIGMTNIYTNINSEKVVGTDLEADYRTSLGGDRSLSFRLLGSYLDEESLNVAGAPVQNLAGVTGNMSLPRVTLNLGAIYSQGPYSAYLNERFISSGKRVYNDNEIWAGGMTLNDDRVASAVYTDLNLSYAMDLHGEDSMQLFLNVQNLLNRAPPVAVYTNTWGYQPTNRGLFDVLGRRFVAGVKFEFK